MRKLIQYLDDKKKERRLRDWIRDISKSEADKNRDDQWKRWRCDQVLRWVGLLLVLAVVVGLFVSVLYMNQPTGGKIEWTNVALIAWKDFLVGAVVIAVIWLVRSLWE